MDVLPNFALSNPEVAKAVTFEHNLCICSGVPRRMEEITTRYSEMTAEDIIESVASIPLSGTFERRFNYSSRMLAAGGYVAFGQAMDVSLTGGQLKMNIQGIKLDLIPVDQTKFLVSQWVLKVGLADFLPLPIDLRKMQIEFQIGDGADEDVMIVNFGDIIYEICPKYPEITIIPAFWEQLSGVYELAYRLPSGNIGDEVIGRDKIQIQDGVLKMPSVVDPIKPISETEIIVLSEPFAGETVVYEPDTGFLYHQWGVYKPTERDLDSE